MDARKRLSPNVESMSRGFIVFEGKYVFMGTPFLLVKAAQKSLMKRLFF